MKLNSGLTRLLSLFPASTTLYLLFLRVNGVSAWFGDYSPLFEDGVPIYLGFFLPLVAAIFYLTPQLRNSKTIGKFLFHTRVGPPIAGIPSWFNQATVQFIPTLMDTTWGGIFFFLGYFTLLWAIIIHHKLEEVDTGFQPRDAWGFAFGVASTFNFALLTLPVSKNSLWLRIIGIPWERALKYHRVLARMAMVFAAAHFIIMKKFWGDEVIYESEIEYYGIMPIFGPVAYFIALFVFVFAADPVRRACYELFKYTHYAGYVVIIMIMFHVDRYIFYQIPFFILNGTDSMIRWTRCWKSHKVTSVKYISGATNIQVELPRKHDMGDYYFVHFPEVSIHEWHPFSAASGNDKLSFFIKDMGAGTFTGKLAEKAKANEKLSIRLDGPYGKLSLDVFNYHTVVMISGGIGVTPMASTAFLLKEKLKSGENMGSLRRIVFVWIVQTHDSFVWLEDLFQGWPDNSMSNSIANSPGSTMDGVEMKGVVSDKQKNKTGTGVQFQTMLYVTKGNAGTPKEWNGTGIQSGRPDFNAMMDEEIKTVGDADNICAMACGPTPMMDGVRTATFSRKIDLHTETFEI